MVAGQDFEDHGSGIDTLAEYLSTGSFDNGQAITQHDSQDFDHLLIAILYSGKLTLDPHQAGRQHPVLE
jgi:hypothetical protein